MRSIATTVVCAFALHLAFPRSSISLLALLGLAGLFAMWITQRPAAAAASGYAAGVVFFALNFSWFGETAGALLGPFGWLLDVAPAMIEACAFAAAAAFTAFAAGRIRGVRCALAAAAGFTLCEIARSSGSLGAPLYQIGAAFVDTPLSALGAMGGVYAMTFAVTFAAAALAVVLVDTSRRPAALRDGAAVGAGIVLVTGAAWLGWPARTLGPATIRVAAVQGNIRQSIKWQAAALPLAVDRYTQLTAGLHAFRPQFVLWPETAVATDLLLAPAFDTDPANAALAAEDRRLRARFAALATSLNAVVAVGSDEAVPGGAFDDVLFFRPRSGLERVYRKRQLVPFAEFLPGPAGLRVLPFASLVSDFISGTDIAPVDAELRVAPLICWETDFTELVRQPAAAGARFLADATDDAWFGDSDGPYAQAQIAQLRALETGRWMVRAAATGVSGIVAPNGRWETQLPLDVAGVATGTIGEPQPPLYVHLGPWPVGVALAFASALAFVGPGRRVRAKRA